MCQKQLNERQTVETLIRRRVLRRLIWVYIACSDLLVRLLRVHAVHHENAIAFYMKICIANWVLLIVYMKSVLLTGYQKMHWRTT